MKFYALKTKRGIHFHCISKTPGELESAINKAFWSWRGCQKKDSNPSLDDYMQDYKKVAVTVENII